MDDWEISDPFSFIGCHAIYSAVNTPIGIVYLGNNGIYSFNGQHSQLLSDNVTPEIKDINPSNFPNVWAEYYKNAYYMAYTSNKTGSSTNDRVLVFDLILNAVSIDLLNIGVFNVFRSGSDVEALYSGSSSSGKVYAHTDTVKEVVHKVHDDFSGTWDDMRYIPTAVGGNASSPVLELAWTETLNDIETSIDTVTGDSAAAIIDRPDTNGFYISQYLNLNALSFDKLYWNETIPGAGGDVRFAIRTGATTIDTAAAAWSSEVTNPTGSDISDITANVYAQYRATMDTTVITYTPTLYRANNFVVKLTYNTVGTSDETTIPLHVRSGWQDMGFPGYKKTLRKVYVYYESESAGTLNVMLETNEGDSDTFAIDLATYPSTYIEYFTSGALTGELFRLDIQETSLNDIKIKKVICSFDLEPLI